MSTNEFALSINQIARLISVNGHDKTYLVRGPMGSGKSSIMNILREQHGDAYHYVTVDCTQLDIGDIQVPDVDKVAGVVRYLPNIMFMGDGTKPVVINFDEFGKASRAVQNAILPIILERRAGIRPLPTGSKVFATTNLGSENVGDLLQAHARNRVSLLEMRHPTAKEWIEWALRNDVPAPVCAWVDQNPQVFMPFTAKPDIKDESEFPYGFHPKLQREAFLTGRSLYLAGVELRDDNRAAVGDMDATMAAVAGNIGKRAAMDLRAFIDLADKFPSWDAIILRPDTAPMFTDSPAAIVLSAFMCVSRCDKANFPAVFTYVRRMPKEVQHIFARQILAIPEKSAWVALNADFTAWIRENHWVMK
jgi:MoxR-like ATPase